MKNIEVEISIGIILEKSVFSLYFRGQHLKTLEYDGKNIIQDCEKAGREYGLKLSKKRIREYHLINGKIIKVIGDKQVKCNYISKEGVEVFIKTLDDFLTNQ